MIKIIFRKLQFGIVYLFFVLPIIISNIYAGNTNKIICDKSLDNSMNTWFYVNFCINTSLCLLFCISLFFRYKLLAYNIFKFILYITTFIELVWLISGFYMFVSNCSFRIFPDAINIIMWITIFYNLSCLLIFIFIDTLYNTYQKPHETDYMSFYDSF